MIKEEAPRWAYGHDATLEYHRIMLDDRERMTAFDRAIQTLVKPGDVVLDLGSGTGVLAMLAARYGARKVYAVESMSVAELAVQLIDVNGLSDIVEVIAEDATQIEPREPVDLIISDFMGNFVVDDYMFPVVRAARGWMHENTRFCPARLEMVLAPVGDFALRALDLFNAPILGLDFSPALEHAFTCGYRANLNISALMSEAQIIQKLVLPDLPEHIDVQHRWRIERAGQLRAVAGWFEAELAPGVTLTTQPGVPTHWGQYLFPLPPTQVDEGDLLELRLSIAEEADNLGAWQWEGRVLTQKNS